MKTYLKNIGVTFITLLAILPLGAYAQSEVETLEWLNVKLEEMKYPESHTVDIESPDIELHFKSDYIQLTSSSGASTSFYWKNIKEVKLGGSYDHTIVILTGDKYEGRPRFINVYISNKELRTKTIKALKHMATLKGAKLINNDLFGN